MSNIAAWRTEHLNALLIPLAALYHMPRPGLHLTSMRDVITNEVTMAFLGSRIEGVQRGEQLAVTLLSICGEGSGELFNEILLPALRESRGELDAEMTWSGDASTRRLTVRDGALATLEGVAR